MEGKPVQYDDSGDKPSTDPKKIQRSSSSTLGFWNPESSNSLCSDDHIDSSSDIMLSSSTGHGMSTRDPYEHSRFVIREIKREEGWSILIGDDIECHVSGEWNDIEYKINSRITVIHCFCCHEEEASDIDFDEGFDSERDVNVQPDDEKENNDPNQNDRRNVIRTRIIVDDTQNYLLIEDDPISVTTLCGSLLCMNKLYLNSKVADIRLSYNNVSLLIGVITHAVMERALIQKNFNLDFLMKQARIVVSEHVVLMYRCGVDEKITLNETLKWIRNIQSFGDLKFDVTETEKRLMSLLFSIKGNADGVGMENVLEIKNCKAPRVEHRAQAIIYSLVLREKTGNDFTPYLYYIQTRELIKIELKHQEIRSLLNLRNRLVGCSNIQECHCHDDDCKVLMKIRDLDDSHFLRRQLNGIDSEEMRSTRRLISSRIEKQNDRLIRLVVDEEIVMNGGYVSLFSKELIKISRGMVESVDGRRMVVKLSEEIRLYRNQTFFVSFESSDIFFRFMRFSLIHIAYPRYQSDEVVGGFVLPDEKADVSCNKPHDDEGLNDHQVGIPECCKDEFMRLNDDQRSALYLSLNCKNYRVIHGMPGTGKSTLISVLIRILVSLKKKVLLICYTNLSLDNILRKLTDVHVYRAGKEKCDFRSVGEMKYRFDEVELVAGTCFSFNDAVYVDRRFDFCVIDEGSQMHLLLGLIPVSMSSRFVIVGDHLQLKPLSRNSKELSVSLFEYLLGSDYSKLRIQYRMGSEIMRLSNVLFYENQLIGSDRSSVVELVDTSGMDLISFVSSLSGCTILCYFNSTCEMIRNMTRCRVETVDRFQGSEDDKVVVVFDPISRCEVMESRERLNVALTRARSHLVLVGNRERMVEIDILRRLIDIL